MLIDTVNNESWYNKGVFPSVRAARHAQYDSYLRHEMVPYVFNRAQRGDLVVYGASFGAYHASNFAARYPDAPPEAWRAHGYQLLRDGRGEEGGPVRGVESRTSAVGAPSVR